MDDVDRMKMEGLGFDISMLVRKAREQLDQYSHGTTSGGSSGMALAGAPVYYTPVPIGEQAALMVHLKLREASVWQREVERQQEVAKLDKIIDKEFEDE